MNNQFDPNKVAHRQVLLDLFTEKYNATVAEDYLNRGTWEFSSLTGGQGFFNISSKSYFINFYEKKILKILVDGICYG